MLVDPILVFGLAHQALDHCVMIPNNFVMIQHTGGQLLGGRGILSTMDGQLLDCLRNQTIGSCWLWNFFLGSGRLQRL